MLLKLSSCFLLFFGTLRIRNKWRCGGRNFLIHYCLPFSCLDFPVLTTEVCEASAMTFNMGKVQLYHHCSNIHHTTSPVVQSIRRQQTLHLPSLEARNLGRRWQSDNFTIFKGLTPKKRRQAIYKQLPLVDGEVIIRSGHVYGKCWKVFLYVCASVSFLS